MSAPDIAMPHMLGARVLATDWNRPSQLAALSPAQWPVRRPAPGNVDLHAAVGGAAAAGSTVHQYGHRKVRDRVSESVSEHQIYQPTHAPSKAICWPDRHTVPSKGRGAPPKDKEGALADDLCCRLGVAQGHRCAKQVVGVILTSAIGMHCG